MVSLLLIFALFALQGAVQGLNFTDLLSNFDVLDTNVTQPFNFTSFPEPCTDLCNNVVQFINTCGTFSCICSVPRETNLTACVNCLVAKEPTDDVIIQGQEVVIRFASTCNANNASIPTQTVSGFTGFPTSTTPAPTSTTPQTSPSPTTTTTSNASRNILSVGGLVIALAFTMLL